MSNVNLEKHYAAFRWAVSKDWKDKNGLYTSIRYKIHVLTNEYALSEEQIAIELFEEYWERGHFQKFDETKGSLNNWIARYVNLYLNHLIRRYGVRAKNTLCKEIDPLDQRNWANIQWIDEENTRDDPDYQPEILFDPTNPEELLIAKETLEFVYGHFNNAEIAYLNGEMDLSEAAEKTGLGSDAFRKRLERRTRNFKNAITALEHNTP